MNWRQAQKKAALLLTDAGIENEAAESWFLMEYCFSMSRSQYFLHAEEEMTDLQLQSYFEAVDQRSRHIPLQYITGEQEFMGLPFKVSPAVLIPRQDSEVLAEECLKVVKPGDRVLDLCTGSGILAVSLSHYGENLQTDASDLSEEALKIARINAAENHCSVRFYCGDLFEAVSPAYDLIVSNPPYIASSVIPGLMPEVRDHEPMMALDGGADGLDFYRRIIEEGMDYLKPGGWLFMEIGYDQSDRLTDLMLKAGYENVETVQDLAGLDRVIKGRKRYV